MKLIESMTCFSHLIKRFKLVELKSKANQTLCDRCSRKSVKVVGGQNKLVTHIYQVYYVFQVKMFPYFP